MRPLLVLQVLNIFPPRGYQVSEKACVRSQDLKRQQVEGLMEGNKGTTERLEKQNSKEREYLVQGLKMNY